MAYELSDIRYPKFKDKDQTIVDLELNHQVYGWIKVTIDIKNPYEFKEIRDLIPRLEIQPYEPIKNSNILLKNKLEQLTVTSSKGRVFDANLEARQNLVDAIIASETLKLKETMWRLADNTEALVTVEELREVHAKAILTYASMKGIVK